MVIGSHRDRLVETSQIWMAFNDGSRITSRFADGRVGIWRRRGERHTRCCMKEVDIFGGRHGLPMQEHFWSSSAGNMIVMTYRDYVPNRVLIPLYRQHGSGLTF